MWRHMWLSARDKKRTMVTKKLLVLAPKLNYQSMKLYEFTICTKYAISYCLTVILIGQWCDNNVTQTCTQRAVGWSPCLRQQHIFHNVKNSQSALPDRRGSAFTSHNWGQCTISKDRIFLLFTYMHTPTHQYWPKCTFWCLTAANNIT